jgi:GT2 family glycosyltransferase
VPRFEPFVSIVTVNYNGRRYLETLLPSLRAIDYPADRYEVLVVDNASDDDSAAFVQRSFPNVRLVQAERNRGFAGGNNLGIRTARGEYIALVNNDTLVDRSWLRALVETAGSDPRIGMVGSKVVFLTPFLDVRVETSTFCPGRSGRSSDDRELGLMLFDARVEGCTYEKTLYRYGCYGREALGGRPGRWTAGSARLAVPVTDASRPATLVLTMAGAPQIPDQRARIMVGDVPAVDVRVPREADTVRVDLDARAVAGAAGDVLNNAGSRLDSAGGFGDRGIFDFDRGQYDRIEDVPALCGVSLLLSRAMLADIGAFDERFFMYFEDSDLSWRARQAGYRLVYTPASLVRHIHAGTSEEWSPFFTFYVTRNHLFWRVKHARPRIAATAVGSLYRNAGGLLAREAFRRMARRHRQPMGGETATVLHVARDLSLRLPGLLASRWLGDRQRLALARQQETSAAWEP